MELRLNGANMNIKKYKKGKDIKLSKNFHLSEAECNCNNCSETLVDLDHVAKLQKLREDLNTSIKVTSWYRCESHNVAVGGSKNSQHKKGTATDIQVRDMDPSEVQDACEHFDGLGRYDSFTHIDSRGSKARWDNRTKKDYLPDEPTEHDLEVILEDLEKDIGL
jgi:uncharacterized protein YcbK (DUF882 family)